MWFSNQMNLFKDVPESSTPREASSRLLSHSLRSSEGPANFKGTKVPINQDQANASAKTLNEENAASQPLLNPSSPQSCGFYPISGTQTNVNSGR